MPPLMEKVSRDVDSTPIQKFYSGANIFITGATGFLGRLLVEKLLRSCPDVGNLYLLIRNKKGKNLHERTEALLDDVIFERLKETDPKFRHKVSAIEGDVCLPGLGISDQDRKLLTTEISVVFHVAATVNFNEKLKFAVPTNICGTQYVIALCREMTNLKGIVHVSTAYSNCTQEIIEEKFYPTPLNPSRLIYLLEALKDDIQEKITKSLLGDFPNTYTYTKAIAENVVLEEGVDLPIGVFRPAIVASTYQEPVKGWINNFYGPTGVVAGAYAGVMKVLFCDKNSTANTVPADMTVNAMIAIPWDVRNKYLEAKGNGRKVETPIYNFELNSQQPITWSEYMKSSEKYGKCYPTIHSLWYYCFFLTTNKWVHFLSVLFLHYLPAFLGDIFLVCMARKPRLVRFYRKIGKFSSVLTYFCTQSFQFKSTRIREMISNMSGEDRKLFFCDLKKLDFDEYFKMYVRGIRIYLLKDPLSTLPKTLVKWRRLYWYHQITKVILSLIILRFLWFILSCGYHLVS